MKTREEVIEIGVKNAKLGDRLYAVLKSIEESAEAWRDDSEGADGRMSTIELDEVIISSTEVSKIKYEMKQNEDEIYEYFSEMGYSNGGGAPEQSEFWSEVGDKYIK